MPAWVIVGERSDGEPVVLVDWVLTESWEPIAEVKTLHREPRLFRDRWRAKRQSRRMPREMAPRAIRYDHL